MKQIKLLGLAIIAMLSLTSTITAASSAATLPNILPEGSSGHAVTGTSSSAKSTFGNGILSVESEKSEGKLESEQPKLGNFDLLFLKVQTVLEPHALCTGLNDNLSGSVLVKGTYHIRDYKANGTLLTAAIFLIRPVHFWCESIPNVLVLVTGCAAGALTPENQLTKALTVTLTKTGSGNTIITVLNEENTANELCELLASENGGANKRSAEVTTQTLTGFKQNGAAVEVLVMRL